MMCSSFVTEINFHYTESRYLRRLKICNISIDILCIAVRQLNNNLDKSGLATQMRQCE